MRKLISNSRLLFLALFFLMLLTIFCARLYQLQIVEGEQAFEESQNSIVSYETVPAARGSLLDRYGRILVSNESCNSLLIDEEELFIDDDYDRINSDILSLCKIITQYGDGYNDELPISMTTPFEYNENISDIEQTLLEAWMQENGLKTDASAVEVMAMMRSRYDIDNSYSAEETRIIAGIRYSINVRYVINTSDYVFADDVSIDTISAILEADIGGIDIQVSYQRKYNTQYAAHILGYTGLMTDTEYDYYKDKGYAYNNIVGKDGSELAFEEYLHGTDGIAKVTRTSTGVITSSIYQDEDGNDSTPQPGNNVYLTIDIDLQGQAEQALAAYITEENAERVKDNELIYATGGDLDDITDPITGGAIVIIDVNTGEPLCMASYPTFDLDTMLDDYEELLADENNPLFNRALLGAYSPGSTFKLCTSLTALCENLLDPSEVVSCSGQYMKYESAGYTPYCWVKSGHGDMDLVNAITNSCNVYFFTVADRVGIDLIDEYASKLGLGELTGIELPEFKGYVASPEKKKEIYSGTEETDWFAGDTLQAAIGQSVTEITPLQLARYVAAIANCGTVYNCSLLKSVTSFDYSEKIYERLPDVFNTIDTSDTVWDKIHEGMYGVVHNVNGSAYTSFRECEVEAAGKTGTTENTGTDDGLFVCYAPYDDPEIAVVVVLEQGGAGSAVSTLARQMLEYYFNFTDSTTSLETEMTILH